MKLLYLSTLDHIIHVMLPHLDAARENGGRVEVACHVTRDPAITLAHCDALHEIPLRRNPLHPASLVALVRLIALIRRTRPDIVHCHNPTGGFIGRLAATLAGTGALRVYTAHGFHFHAHGGKIANAVYRAIESLAGRFLSDAVLTINEEDYAAARQIMPPEKVFFTHGVGVSARKHFNPALVTPEERQAIRDEFGVGDDELLLTCIGEMIPRKRHEAAIAWVATARAAGLVLALVGDGPLRARLKRQAAAESIPIRFPGFRRDIRAILAASDIFLFPSVQEGLPCAVQEALAMEVPVVCNDIRGCRELVDETCGRRIAPADAGKALNELLSLTSEERKALGRAGREKMLRFYDRSLCVAEVQKIYRQLLEARK